MCKGLKADRQQSSQLGKMVFAEWRTGMNLTNFLKQTDALTAQYSTEQPIAFIHEIGRVFPEHHREKFLEMLKSVGNQVEKASSKSEAKDIDFGEMYCRIRDNLKSINSQEVTITGILNEEYDDWYDDSKDEFYYEDNSGISDMLEEACDFVHICMDMERYHEGFEVGNQMLAMEILCDNEYGDEELPAFEDFLPLWITYLGGKKGHEADRLILEAVGLLNDVLLEVQYAEKYAAVHPGLYLSILENGNL